MYVLMPMHSHTCLAAHNTETPKYVFNELVKGESISTKRNREKCRQSPEAYAGIKHALNVQANNTVDLVTCLRISLRVYTAFYSRACTSVCLYVCLSL